MFHKFTLLTLISVLATACSLTISTPTPTSPPMPEATPTSTKTPIPTQTPVPTETPDPMAGAPEGATGKNSKGEWIKEKNGETYEWVDIKTGPNPEDRIEGWYTDHGGGPLMDQSKDGFGPLIYVDFNFKYGLSGPYIKHENNTVSSTAPSWTRMLYTRLMERHFSKKYKSISRDQKIQFGGDLYSGKITFPYFDSLGDERVLKIKDNQGNDVFHHIYIVNWEDSLGEGFLEHTYNDKHFRVMVVGDVNGQAKVIVALQESIDSLTSEEFHVMSLFGLFRVFDAPDLSDMYFRYNQRNNPRFYTFIDDIEMDAKPHFIDSTTP